MGFVKQVKETMVRELAERYRSYKNFVLVDYRGLNGPRSNDLRKLLRKDGVRMMVVKNAVARLAFDQLGYKELAGLLEGMNAVVYGEDPVTIAKKLTEFNQKAQPPIAIRGGLVEGRPMSAKDIEQLSQLMSKPETLAAMLGTMAAPLAQWLSTVNAIISQFLLTLKALEEKKGKEQPQPQA